MSERTPDVPPVIMPLTDGTYRPLWSVMIPTYNCISFLSETIHSVLSQDMGEAIMQIEVVDDCSTDGDVAALIQRIGNGRIKYFRQEQNRGSLRNFETCINRAQGQWVHLLHGDDRVEFGFYQEIATLFSEYPEVGAAFTNFSFMYESSNKQNINKSILLDKAGIIPDFLTKIADQQLLTPPAIVVKRSVYEAIGSFYAVHYGEDWEMWTRIASRFPVAYSPKCLAAYRLMRNDSITHKSNVNGQTAVDMIKVMNIIQNYIPPEKRIRQKKHALKWTSIHLSHSAHLIYVDHPAAALSRVKEAWKIHKNINSLYSNLKLFLKLLIHYKGRTEK